MDKQINQNILKLPSGKITQNFLDDDVTCANKNAHEKNFLIFNFKNYSFDNLEIIQKKRKRKRNQKQDLSERLKQQNVQFKLDIKDDLASHSFKKQRNINKSIRELIHYADETKPKLELHSSNDKFKFSETSSNLNQTTINNGSMLNSTQKLSYKHFFNKLNGECSSSLSKIQGFYSNELNSEKFIKINEHENYNRVSCDDYCNKVDEIAYTAQKQTKNKNKHGRFELEEESCMLESGDKEPSKIGEENSEIVHSQSQLINNLDYRKTKRKKQDVNNLQEVTANEKKKEETSISTSPSSSSKKKKHNTSEDKSDKRKKCKLVASEDLDSCNSEKYTTLDIYVSTEANIDLNKTEESPKTIKNKNLHFCNEIEKKTVSPLMSPTKNQTLEVETKIFPNLKSNQISPIKTIANFVIPKLKDKKVVNNFYENTSLSQKKFSIDSSLQDNKKDTFKSSGSAFIEELQKTQLHSSTCAETSLNELLHKLSKSSDEDITETTLETSNDIEDSSDNESNNTDNSDTETSNKDNSKTNTPLKRKSREKWPKSSAEILTQVSTIENKLYNYDLSADEIDILKNLRIDVPDNTSVAHMLPQKLARYLSAKETIDFEQQGIHFKKGSYTLEEDAQIKSNWLNFCKTYKLIDQNTKPFCVLTFNGKPYLGKQDTLNFVRHLGINLENRGLCSIYNRFKTIYKGVNKGSFSEEENKLILTFCKNSKIKNKFAALSIVLNRTRDQISEHYDHLIADDKRLSSNNQMIQELVNNVLRVTGHKSISDLKDVTLTRTQWRDIQQNMSIHFRKLLYFWEYSVYPCLFFNNYTYLNEVREKLINYLCQKEITDRQSIQWSTVAKEFDSTGRKMSYIFKDMFDKYVPDEHKNNFKKTLKILKGAVKDMEDKKIKKLDYKGDKIIFYGPHEICM